MSYTELKQKFDEAKAKALAITAAATAENRTLTDEEQQQILGYVTEAKGYDDQRRKLDSDRDIRKSIEELGFVLPPEMDHSDMDPAKVVTPTRGKSIGEQFVTHEDYQRWYKHMAPRGQISEGVKFDSPQVPFKGFKALITGLSDTSAGAMVFNDVQPMVELPFRPLTLRQAVTNGRTTSDVIEFVREVSRTNNAAPVAEAVDVGDGSGVKPQSNFVLEKVTETVKTIAHWIAITRRALADAAQVETMINNFLLFGLEEELEDQMINGTGVGENLTGLDTVTGTQDQAWDTNILVTTRKAKTKVRVVGRAVPTAYVFHPNDWELIQLTRDDSGAGAGTGGFFYGGPADPRPVQTLWGLPVIESEAATAGFGWVGDFRKLVLWDREQAGITVSNSHSDFFIRNLVAILSEMRVAYGCLRPVAFVEIDLTA